MRLDTTETAQNFFYNLSGKLNAKVEKASYGTQNKAAEATISISGFIGVTLLQVIGRVASVAESLFIGLINIAGAPFSSKCSASLGLRQISLETGNKMLAAAIKIIYTPSEIIGIFIRKFSDNQYLNMIFPKNISESVITLYVK